MSEKVKCIVLAGTLHFEDGTFQKGEEFEVSLERAKQFDQKDILIVMSEIVPEVKEPPKEEIKQEEEFSDA